MSYPASVGCEGGGWRRRLPRRLMHYGPVVGADLDDDDSNSALSSKVALRSQCTRGAQARQAPWWN